MTLDDWNDRLEVGGRSDRPPGFLPEYPWTLTSISGDSCPEHPSRPVTWTLVDTSLIEGLAVLPCHELAAGASTIDPSLVSPDGFLLVLGGPASVLSSEEETATAAAFV